MPKAYSKMNAKESAHATQFLDEEFVADQFGPPNAAARKQLVRAKKRAGRPKVGKGAVRILTTVEKGLLEKADRYRERKGMTRAEMIGQGLKLVMAGK